MSPSFTKPPNELCRRNCRDVDCTNDADGDAECRCSVRSDLESHLRPGCWPTVGRDVTIVEGPVSNASVVSAAAVVAIISPVVGGESGLLGQDGLKQHRIGGIPATGMSSSESVAHLNRLDNADGECDGDALHATGLVAMLSRTH